MREDKIDLILNLFKSQGASKEEIAETKQVLKQVPEMALDIFIEANKEKIEELNAIQR
jgi:hypothetical protein